ncbi:MAG: prepilin-type N-terminal cleavage/methylation domain-containing protein [Candidatus Berkelbacteria bacterium]|nr:prepilin-type N-terminal cleavage/methylation domain-containing protein [Candidatus Berkelbacteria bacterium]
MKQNKALTLLEVIIATFIFLVGLLSVVQLYPLSYKVNRISNHLTIASSLGQEKIEELLSKDYSETSSISRQKINTNPNSPFYQYEWEAKVHFVDPDNNLAEIENDKGIKKIQVLIYWQENGQEKQLDVSTLNTKR